MQPRNFANIISGLQDRQILFTRSLYDAVSYEVCKFSAFSLLFVVSCEGEETTMYLKNFFAALSISLGLVSTLPAELDAADASHLFERVIGSTCSTPVQSSHSSSHNSRISDEVQ